MGAKSYEPSLTISQTPFSRPAMTHSQPTKIFRKGMAVSNLPLA
jgi:hypothetical protein